MEKEQYKVEITSTQSTTQSINSKMKKEYLKDTVILADPLETNQKSTIDKVIDSQILWTIESYHLKKFKRSSYHEQ